jgi:hypothetical protein
MVFMLNRFHHLGGKETEIEKMDDKWFKLSGTFVAGSILITGIIAALYWVFW